jgi:WD repeat-containing protein 32
MRLTHDNSKMVICTNEGYYLIVHDLNLDTVKQDLAGFHPDLYHLMQKGSPFHYDFGSWFNKLFTAKKNRVELISDFPPGVDGHHITSLDLHPSSWAILSRGITRNDDAEYTFVHDIQDDIKPTKLITMSIPTENNVTTYHNPLSRMAGFVQTHSDSISTVMASSPEPQDTMSPVIIISSQTPSRRPHATILNPQQISLEHRARRFIYKNEPRLTHYQKEANVGHGYIKELCFSPEGRVICSPFEFGFRLSSFDENFREMSRCRTRGEDGLISKPSELNVLKTILPHSDFVVTTKFSPTHLLIASGCLSGRLVFSMPCL